MTLPCHFHEEFVIFIRREQATVSQAIHIYPEAFQQLRTIEGSSFENHRHGGRLRGACHWSLLRGSWRQRGLL